MPLSREQRLVLAEAFVARLSALEPSAWSRIAARCSALEGPTFDALLRRAEVATRPMVVPLRRAGGDGLLGMLFGAMATTMRVAGVVGALVAEFKPPDPTLPDRMASDAATVDDEHHRRQLLVFATLERALLPYAHTHPGMATAVRTAGYAVSCYDLLDPSELAGVYAVMEPEIPLADLQQRVGFAPDAA